MVVGVELSAGDGREGVGATRDVYCYGDDLKRSLEEWQR